MKSVIVIDTHSFVDLITNSSSELFVCNTTKTVDMVKGLLKELLEMHGRLQGTPTKYSFSDVFGDIQEALYTYNLDLFDPGVVEAWKLYQRAYYDDHQYGRGQSRPVSFVTAVAEEEELQRTHPYFTQMNSSQPATEEEEKQRDTWCRDSLRAEDAIWTKFGAEKAEMDMCLFVEFLKFNNFSIVDIATVQALIPGALTTYITNNRGKYGECSDLFTDVGFPAHLQPVVELYEEYSSWGYRVHKGNIMVRSADDNSVPHELFELIQTYLAAKRYHLG